MADSLVPETWTVAEVNVWATEARLAKETIDALLENFVDGATLVTLTKSEIRSELCIASLPARRHLWDLVKNLQPQQETMDFAVATQVHQEEIDQGFRASEVTKKGPDIGSYGCCTNDADGQKYEKNDRLVAHRLQRTMNHGQQIHEDVSGLSHEDLAFAEDLPSTIVDRAATPARRQHVRVRRGGGTSNGVSFSALMHELRSAIQNVFRYLIRRALERCLRNEEGQERFIIVGS